MEQQRQPLKTVRTGLQEKWIREWVQKRMGSSPAFKITFYCGRYDNAFKSIFPVGDLTNYIPDDEVSPSVLPCTDEGNLTSRSTFWSHHAHGDLVPARQMCSIIIREAVVQGSVGNAVWDGLCATGWDCHARM